MNPPIGQIRFSLGLVMTMQYFVKWKFILKCLCKKFHVIV
jgi:hypothetical protein